MKDFCLDRIGAIPYRRCTEIYESEGDKVVVVFKEEAEVLGKWLIEYANQPWQPKVGEFFRFKGDTKIFVRMQGTEEPEGDFRCTALTGKGYGFCEYLWAPYKKEKEHVTPEELAKELIK